MYLNYWLARRARTPPSGRSTEWAEWWVRLELSAGGRWSRARPVGRRSATSRIACRRRRWRCTAYVSSPDILRDENCAYGLVRQLNEGTLHERDDRCV